MRHNNYRYNKSRKKIATYILFAVFGIAIGGGIIAFPKIQAYMDRIALDQQNAETLQHLINENALEKTIENIEEELAEENVENDSEVASESIDKEIEEEETVEKEVVILESAYLDVPFVCQAPFQTEANWVYHEESCEEAALLQVHYYLEGIAEADKQTAHNTILDMIEWQKENFGEHRDIYAKEMKDFIVGYYGYNPSDVEIIYDAEIVDIKRAISQGYPVIVPITGELLRNPYYPYPGYHMLTVIGYTPDNIVTNDVGTRRGADFSYSYERFKIAMDSAGGDIIIIHKLPKK